MGFPESATETMLRTIMSDIVEWMNERPLVDVPLRHEDAPALTPNHFLKPCLHDSDQTDIQPEHLWDRYGENRELMQEWWKTWSRVYLPALAHRPTHGSEVEPINVGDLVFFQHENGFSRGRIAEIFVDPETNQVREMIVATSKRRYRRAATQVAKIRIQSPPSAESHQGDTILGMEETQEDQDDGKKEITTTTEEQPEETTPQTNITPGTTGPTRVESQRNGTLVVAQSHTPDLTDETIIDADSTHETEDKDTRRPRETKQQTQLPATSHASDNRRKRTGIHRGNEALVGPITRSKRRK